MFYREDWLMRQIETAIAIIIQMVTAKGRHAAPMISQPSEDVMTLLRQGEVCEAENLLFFAPDDLFSGSETDSTRHGQVWPCRVL